MAVGAIYLTDQSSGAPALSGSNGTLCNVLDWALVQKGWAIEYTAANNRVYRPGAGNRNRLFVCHDSAVTGDARLALVRGCENASAANVANLTNPFPTVAQTANNLSTVLCSTTASAAARGYRIILTDRFVLMFINCAVSNVANWDFFMFGDLSGVESGDVYATICHNGNVATATSTSGRSMGAGLSTGYYVTGGKTYFARSIDGSVLSSSAVLFGSGSNTSGAQSPCSVTGAPSMRSGYANRIDREKVGVNCAGSSGNTAGGLAVHRRGWVPHLWNPLHSSIGSVTADDVFTDSAYASGSSFCICPAASGACFILETTDTWSPPSG